MGAIEITNLLGFIVRLSIVVPTMNRYSILLHAQKHEVVVIRDLDTQ